MKYFFLSMLITTSVFSNTMTCKSPVENIIITQVNDSEIYVESELENFFALLAVRTGLSKGIWTGYYVGQRSFQIVDLQGLKVVEGNLTYYCE